MTARDGPAPEWHVLPAEEVLGRLESRAEGLPEAEAAARLVSVGRNILPEPSVSSKLVVFLRQLRSPLIYVLMAASVVSLSVALPM